MFADSMSEPSKRGGARPNTGPKPKPAGQTATVRFSLALTPAEAEKYRLLGAPWVRRMLASMEAEDSQEVKDAISEIGDGHFCEGLRRILAAFASAHDAGKTKL